MFMYSYCYVYVFLLTCVFYSVYSVSSCCSVYYSMCKCVLYCCHRVSTQLKSTNISYHISKRYLRIKKNQSARARTKIQKKSFVINVARLKLNRTPHISPSTLYNAAKEGFKKQNTGPKKRKQTIKHESSCNFPPC